MVDEAAAHVQGFEGLDKMGFNLETSLAVMALAPPLVGSVVTVIRAPMETLNQLDAAVDFILPLFPTSPSKAGSRNPPPLVPCHGTLTGKSTT